VAPVRPVRRRVILPERPGRQNSVPERTFNSREELQQHLREQQLDAIRTGKPPLPIPVTDDMVDQLVDEGWSLPKK